MFVCLLLQDSDDFLSAHVIERACWSHTSSMQQDSDDEFAPPHTSSAEPTRSTRSEKHDDDKTDVWLTNSDSFMKLGQRKTSLADHNVKESDVYSMRNPSDSWLRKQLNEIKQAAQVKNTPVKVEDRTQAVGKENLTIEDIKQRYGKQTRTPKVQEKGKTEKLENIFFKILETRKMPSLPADKDMLNFLH